MTNTLEKAKAFLQELGDEMKDLSEKERFEFLIEYGETLPVRADFCLPENKIPGCVSEVFFQGECVQGKFFFKLTSQSFIVRGYGQILIDVLSGLTPKEIVEMREEIFTYIKKAHLNVSLIESRSNAFLNIYNAIVAKAVSFLD